MAHSAETRRRNLIKLMLGLIDMEFEVQFDMGCFASKAVGYGMDPREVKNECGTSACLLGHGPICGIAPTTGLECTDWDYYGELFVPWRDFYFLFGADWPSSIRQGLARIHRMLKSGAPKEFNYKTSIYRLPTKADIQQYRLELQSDTKGE